MAEKAGSYYFKSRNRVVQRFKNALNTFRIYISKLSLVVNLDCHKCYTKMRKILCQLQDCERIQTISFDDKTITIVGPFDPHRLACKLRCKGGKVVKDIHIVDYCRPPRSCKPTHEENPSSAPEPRPSSTNQPHPDGREIGGMVPQPAEVEPPPSPAPKEKPMYLCMPVAPVKERPPPPPMVLPACPARPLEQPVEYVIPTVEIPLGPCGCPCRAPCYQGCYEGCRCVCCGRVCSYAVSVRPLPSTSACGEYSGCRTFSDDDPSAACSIM